MRTTHRLTKSAFSDTHPMEVAILLWFATYSYIVSYWLNATTLILSEGAIELTVTTHEMLAAVRLWGKQNKTRLM